MIVKKTFFSVIILLLSFVKSYAQESTTAAGGDASGVGGTAAFSIGQVVYTTNTSTSGSVSQGVQQAYEIFSASMIENDLNVSISIFPNPTTDLLTLQIADYKNEKWSYLLYDAQGKLIDNALISSSLTEIKTAKLTAASYFLDIVNQDLEKIHSFKIIKK